MYIVETEGLVKKFGKIIALNGLNLHVPKGISGFIGPNGAGKTTTMRARNKLKCRGRLHHL